MFFCLSYLSPDLQNYNFMNKDNFLRFIIAAIKRLIASAVAEKISVIATDDYLQ